jgi:hypothetical protein
MFADEANRILRAGPVWAGLAPGLSATCLSTTAAASSAGDNSFPSADTNPFWSFLNALNRVSPANAAEDEGGGLPPVLLELLLHGLIDAATAKRLAEQQKFLQDAEEARKDFLEFVQGRPSSRALGVARRPRETRGRPPSEIQNRYQ